MAGRLTLSWANKHMALVSTPDGGYEWVRPDDPRANEVRLLDELGRVGDATTAPDENLLIRGDSADALRALASTPEYADVYRGKVKLVYIDPVEWVQRVNAAHTFGTWHYLLVTETQIAAASDWTTLVRAATA